MADFFSTIDDQIDKQKEDKNSNEEKKKNNEEFATQTINRLLPILDEYVEQLKQRNINVSPFSNVRSISLKLLYRDSGHHSLVMSTNLDTGRIEFRNYFTSDDGKNYESTDGSSYDENTWKDDIFKNQLEKLITDFIFYAPRHGGF